MMTSGKRENSKLKLKLILISATYNYARQECDEMCVVMKHEGFAISVHVTVPLAMARTQFCLWTAFSQHS